MTGRRGLALLAEDDQRLTLGSHTAHPQLSTLHPSNPIPATSLQPLSRNDRLPTSLYLPMTPRPQFLHTLPPLTSKNTEIRRKQPIKPIAPIAPISARGNHHRPLNSSVGRASDCNGFLFIRRSPVRIRVGRWRAASE